MPWGITVIFIYGGFNRNKVHIQRNKVHTLQNSTIVLCKPFR